MDRCIDFDQFKATMGYGPIKGIQGEICAPQEEKPHQFRFKLIEGRATMHYRLLAAPLKDGKYGPLPVEQWQPKDGVDILKNVWWPNSVDTKDNVFASRVEQEQLAMTMERVCAFHETDKDVSTVRASWENMLEWLADTPQAAPSATWIKFCEIFNLEDHRKITHDAQPQYIHRYVSTLSLQQQENVREGKTGVPPPDADIAGERQAVMEARSKAEDDLKSGKREVEVAKHPQDAVGKNAYRARLKTITFEVGKLIAVLTDEQPLWSICKIIQILPDDMLRVHYWGNETVDHVGGIFPLKDKNDGYKYTKVNVELKMIIAVVIVLNKNKTISKSNRVACERAVARHTLGLPTEAPASKKQRRA
jgi:hypothetical protein